MTFKPGELAKPYQLALLDVVLPPEGDDDPSTAPQNPPPRALDVLRRWLRRLRDRTRCP